MQRFISFLYEYSDWYSTDVSLDQNKFSVFFSVQMFYQKLILTVLIWWKHKILLLLTISIVSYWNAVLFQGVLVYWIFFFKSSSFLLK